MKPGRPLAVAETAVLLLTGLFLFQALTGGEYTSSEVRNYIVLNGSRETGALNLVTSIYLGYRAFDTLGETMVLLIAVSGVLYFLVTREEKNEEENNDS
jgi:multicomponent Na+:H+ antiporter subunit B